MCISELLRALCARKIHNNYDDMNYSKLIAAIDDRIRANGRREITGQTLHDVLEAMVRSLGAGYQVAGVLGPDDDPGEPDQRFAWLASEAGVYRHCGGVSVTELSWLIWGGGQWLVRAVDVPFGASVREWIADAVAEERSRAMIAEALLQGGIDKEVADRTEAVASEARERAEADAEEKAAREKAVADEQARAERAEQANAAAIAKETSDRAEAVKAEADARTAADTALGERVDAEIADRKAAVTAEETARKSADAALDGRVTAVEGKIPAQASAENQLADKAFVNSSISTATATFRGTFESLEALKAAEADKNDYAFWAHKDEDGNTCYDKYTYDGAEWKFEYRLNNSSFTAAQWAAINSGVTADVIKALQDADEAHAKAIADEKTERIAAVKAEQTAREQADTANANAIATEATERKAADATLQGNIDKKQDTLESGTNIKTIDGKSLLGSGDLAVSGGLPTIKAGTGPYSETFNASPDARSKAEGECSHAEGFSTSARGFASHAEGMFSVARGDYSHAEGQNTFAGADYSHAEGQNIDVRSESAHGEGRYNASVPDAIHMVGIGESHTARKNAHTIKKNGKHYILGVGGYVGTEMSDAQFARIKDLATVISELESAGGGPFALTLTLGTGDEWAMDCTFEELAAAVDAKRGIVFAVNNGSYDGEAFTATLQMHSSAENVVVLQGYANKAYIYVVVTNSPTGLTVDVSEVNLVNIDTTIPAAPSNANVPGTKAVKDYVDKYAPCVIVVDSVPASGFAIPYVIKSGELSPYRVIVLACDTPDGYREVNVFGLWIGNTSIYYGFAMSATGEMVKIAFDTSVGSLSTNGDL